MRKLRLFKSKCERRIMWFVRQYNKWALVPYPRGHKKKSQSIVFPFSYTRLRLMGEWTMKNCRDRAESNAHAKWQINKLKVHNSTKKPYEEVQYSPVWPKPTKRCIARRWNHRNVIALVHKSWGGETHKRVYGLERNTPNWTSVVSWYRAFGRRHTLELF